MTVSGHKTRSVFERYNIQDQRDQREAARRLADYISTQNEALQKKTSTKNQNVEVADVVQ